MTDHNTNTNTNTDPPERSFLNQFTSNISNQLESTAELRERVEILEQQVKILIAMLHDRKSTYAECCECKKHGALLYMLFNNEPSKNINLCAREGCLSFVCKNCVVIHNEFTHEFTHT